MREIKKRLRKELIEQRRSMDKNIKALADSDIFEQIKPLLDGVSSVFTYASTDIEVDTRRLIDFCLEQDIPVALPISGDTELSFYFIEGTDELSCGRFGIDEPPAIRPAVPDENTLCVVPALCADGTGLRLGYGRGYYDRFLETFVGKSVIVCYKAFKRSVPTEEHDRKADLTIFDR
ncbi:MAG: 5-formyltetrahydrofolate cyclo-ligase [Oscillospiraceae bacterium]